MRVHDIPVAEIRVAARQSGEVFLNGSHPDGSFIATRADTDVQLVAVATCHGQPAVDHDDAFSYELVVGDLEQLPAVARDTLTVALGRFDATATYGIADPYGHDH